MSQDQDNEATDASVKVSGAKMLFDAAISKHTALTMMGSRDGMVEGRDELHTLLDSYLDATEHLYSVARRRMGFA